MTRRRAWLAAGAVAAAAAVAVVLVLVLGGGGSGRAPARAVVARTVLAKSGVLFADPLRVTIQVLVDRERVDPAKIGFDTRFAPFTRVGIPRVTRRDAGRLTRLQYTANVLCVTATCLPTEQTRRVVFEPAKVFFTRRHAGRRRSLQVEWAPLTVGSRTTDLDLANADPFLQPSWHASTEPLAVSWRVPPSLLRPLLFVGGGILLALGAVGILVARRTAVRRRRPALSALERAVLLVEQAAARADTPEQRKALELLARELATRGEPDLAVAARELAWAERPPVAAATEPLTVGVRQMIGEGANGDGR